MKNMAKVSVSFREQMMIWARVQVGAVVRVRNSVPDRLFSLAESSYYGLGETRVRIRVLIKGFVGNRA